MKINETAIRTRAAIVARDAAIVARVKTRTTDATRRTLDTRLSAETGSYNPNMLGTVWVGGLKVALGSLNAADRKLALDAMRKVLDDDDDDGSGSSLATDRPEMEFDIGATATPQSVNDANRAFWADKANRSVTRDRLPHRGARVTADDVNAINAAYWASQPTHRLGAAWGKG